MRQRVAIGAGLVSVHWAPGLTGIVRGMTKNVFAVFRYSAGALVAAAVAMGMLCVGPAIYLAVPGGRLACCIALASILGLYGLSARTSRISGLYGLGMPIAAMITIYAMLRSMVLAIHRGGITWRGTFYPLSELRKHDRQMRARDEAAARG
jgi:hypothetical protein